MASGARAFSIALWPPACRSPQSVTTAGMSTWAPVRDFLVTIAPPDVSALSAVAEAYAKRNQVAAAVELLLGLDQTHAAAALLSSAPPSALDAIDVLEYQACIERIDRATLDRHPAVLLHLARMYDGAALFEKRSAVLDRLDALAASEPRLLAALEVERITDLLRLSQYDLVYERATQFLTTDDGVDEVTRARALSALARATCQRRDASGIRDEAAMRRANELFSEVATSYRRIGLDTVAVGMVPYQAMWIQFALGNTRAALATLEEGLALVSNRPRRWAFLQSFRGEVLVELGRYEEAHDAVRDVYEVGERLDDEELRAFAWWSRATIASHLGDVQSVIEHLRPTATFEQAPGRVVRADVR